MSASVPQTSTGTSQRDGSPNLSMREVENEIVDISSSLPSSGSSSKVKLLFAKSKGTLSSPGISGLII